MYRERYRMRFLSHWWLSNCHKLNRTLRKYGSIRAKWDWFRPAIPFPFASGLLSCRIKALSVIAAETYDTFIAQLLWIKFYFRYYVFPWRKVKFMEGGCHIFLIYLVDCFFSDLIYPVYHLIYPVCYFQCQFHFSKNLV